MPRRPRNVLLPMEVRIAGKRCTCKRDSAHIIHKGEVRLVVRDPGPAGGEKGYCGACGRAMLDRACQELQLLGTALGVGPAPKSSA